MANLDIYITTFNCARQPIDTQYFATCLFHGQNEAGSLPPDLIVLCLQEFAPISYSFLGGSLITPFLARFSEAVHHAVVHRFGPDPQFEAIASRHVGMTAILVFATREIRHRIRQVSYAEVGVGLWEMGNKGAVSVRLRLNPESGGDRGDDEEEMVLTFVAAHLAPMEDQCERRNRDWQSICQGLVYDGKKRKERRLDAERHHSDTQDELARPLLSGSGDERPDDSTSNQETLFSPTTHIFLAGDLNYRTADHFDPTTFEFPKPTASENDLNHYSHLLQQDQLIREMKNERTLHHLSEAHIAFPPTYKYSKAAQRRVAASLATVHRQKLADGRAISTTQPTAPIEEEEEWLWALHRTPSWCDRVLFLDSSAPKIKAYTSLPIQPTSDHRPVALYCSISDGAIESDISAPFQVRQDWKERRAAARRLEIAVGCAAYLTLTWEGRAILGGILAGVAVGVLALEALLRN